MKPTPLYLCLITALLLLMACVQKAPEPAATTEEEAAPTIEGVWTAEEVETVGGPDEGINTSPQPSLCIFTELYYSVMFVDSAKPRSLFETATHSDAEIVKAYATFTANSGTYELEGSNIMFHPSVAKDPNFMS